MGREVRQSKGSLMGVAEHDTFTSMEGLRFYQDAIGFLPNGEREKEVAPGELFTLFVVFPNGHPMFENKTHVQQAKLMARIAGGDFSLRSKIAITGVTVTEEEQEDPRYYQLDDGSWVMRMRLANDGSEKITVPTGLKIGKPFERPEKGLSGKELLETARSLSDINHIQFVTKSGMILGSEHIPDEALEDPYHELYPVAVFLPYTEEVGNLKPGGLIDLGNVPGRKEGYEDRYVNWEGVIGHSVILKRTRGTITIPKGYVGVIREQGVEGEVPHSRSTVLDSDSDHVWPIVGEHPLRNANGNVQNPTGFVMDLYRTA